MPFARTFTFHVSRLECLDFQVMCFGLQCWMTVLVFKCLTRLTAATTSTQRSFTRPGTQRKMPFSFLFILAGFMKNLHCIVHIMCTCPPSLMIWCVISNQYINGTEPSVYDELVIPVCRKISQSWCSTLRRPGSFFSRNFYDIIINNSYCHHRLNRRIGCLSKFILISIRLINWKQTLHYACLTSSNHQC